ncbi:MAG: ATP-dependent RecD-like DNA helicase [Oscillospiraceae bacterium]|nr:ATP-dependent RecD-like DNA helicase [Oscillospiraceae bacterium]
MEETLTQELSGTVDEIVFANEENGYTVLRLETQDGESVTVTGCIPFAAPGERLTVGGKWVSHASYGQQFQAEYADRSMPRGAEAVYEYLASRVVRGVGPATASVIVSAFGERALDVMEREPEKLAGLKGISLKKAREISEALKKQLGLRHLMEFLSAHGLKPQFAMRLYRAYAGKAMELIQENPYLLCASHIGAPFSEADRLALDLGMEGDSAERVAAAVLFELQYNTGNGHVFIPREKLILATAQLLDLEAAPVEEGLDVLLDSGEVVCETVANCRACYLAALHEAESYCAEHLGRMAEAKRAESGDFSELLEEIEADQGIRYAPMQRKTLELAARNRLLLITGGPGTGKTTTVRAIIAMYERQGLKVQLAAPTGRAAKRLGELTGREASTVHRLLEAGYAEDGFDLVFKRDENQPLKCDVLILDECSMIDITLLRAILAALPADCRLILVGDADQLPSVGPGNVFLDILRSHRAAVARLTEIFRQTADSRIVRYAHAINAGEHPNFRENKGDVFFMRRLNQSAAVELIVQLCGERLPKNMGIRPEEIQVLTPTRKGGAGVKALNAALQAALNPLKQGRAEKPFGNVVFRVGDRVMQIRNNYDIIWTNAEHTVSGTGVFNGDVGYVAAIEPATETLSVDYDGRLAVYAFDQLGEIEHAWAMTVHKSQGSEYRAVILCLCGGPQQLMYRGVLYTAVTRARELLILVGDERLAEQMIDNHKQTRRYSGLRARLAGETG